MKRFFFALVSTAFAATSVLSILVTSAQSPLVSGRAALLSAASQAALAEKDDRGNNDDRGNSGDCVNPAGHEKGWCKHQNENNQGDNEDHKRKHRKHGNGSRSNGSNSLNAISGTVTAVNGTNATVRLDNGQIVTVRENGTQLNVGQHVNLNGCYQNGVFVLGCYANNNYPTGNSQQISGTILSVSGNTLTLAGIPPVSIDISRAIANGQVNGQLTPLRHVTISGSYQNGAFYATSIH
jgi:hypothetical protein